MSGSMQHATDNAQRAADNVVCCTLCVVCCTVCAVCSELESEVVTYYSHAKRSAQLLSAANDELQRMRALHAASASAEAHSPAAARCAEEETHRQWLSTTLSTRRGISPTFGCTVRLAGLRV